MSLTGFRGLLLACLLLGACAAGGGDMPCPVDSNEDGNPFPLCYDKVRTTLDLPAAGGVLLRADFDGDGRTDLLAGDDHVCFSNTPLVVLRNLGDGTFEDGTSEVIVGDTSVDAPLAVGVDFNMDGRADVAVFDAGCKAVSGNVGNYLGGPPTLLLSTADGRLEVSNALAEAVETYNTNISSLDPQYPFSGTALHVKNVLSVDVDDDGDQDIFVESTGGENITSHFYLSNGDGTFVIDHGNRLTLDAHSNFETSPGNFWRFSTSVFADLNGDQAPDLVMGQIRDTHPTHIDQSSIVLFNDQQGYFPIANRVLLPLPEFNLGHTAVASIVAGDINGDGHPDLVLAHQRNDGVEGSPPDVGEPFTGRFIQVLINDGGSGTFTDQTALRMGDQATTLAELRGNVPREMLLHDLDEDGDADLITANAGHISASSPLLYLNDGAGNFSVLEPELFTGGDEYYGEQFVPLDLNNDGLLDFAGPDRSAGADGTFGNTDDRYNFDALIACIN